MFLLGFLITPYVFEIIMLFHLSEVHSFWLLCALHCVHVLPFNCPFYLWRKVWTFFWGAIMNVAAACFYTCELVNLRHISGWYVCRRRIGRTEGMMVGFVDTDKQFSKEVVSISISPSIIAVFQMLPEFGITLHLI